ncbi:MAG: fatty acid--CoA ligase family protein [Gemmatimonadetes bacterium]|nr:fatty acid--CoA ligase family protein [Gemmatimonadota bacterium]
MPPSGDLLSALAIEHIDRVAVRSDAGARTYGEVSAAAESLATELAGRRTDPARPIGHAFGLVPEAVAAALAVARLRAVLAPANPAWTAPERDRFDEILAPGIVLAPPEAPWTGSGWSHETVALPGLGPVSVGARAETRSGPPPTTPPGTEVVLWTSGSGGTPKIACHGWAGLLAAARAANARLGLGSGDCWLATLSWAHVGGLALLPRALAAGASIAFSGDRFDPALALDGLRTHRATHVSLVPAMMHRLIERSEPPPAELRVALVGGAATPPRVTRRAVAAGWPISLTYGLTEAGSQVATATPEEVCRRPGAVGRALDDVELEIDDAPGESGEISIRGPGLLLGYLGEPARDPEDWFATGDLGAIDEEGGLRVTGRLGDRILSGGVNVDPRAVEDVIAEHPDVREVCVVGLPDPVWGQIVTGVVGSDRPDLAGELDAWSRTRLSGARTPRRWLIVSALPRTGTGKTDRAAVIELVEREAPNATNEEPMGTDR